VISFSVTIKVLDLDENAPHVLLAITQKQLSMSLPPSEITAGTRATIKSITERAWVEMNRYIIEPLVNDGKEHV
jgi:hypothetical protein